MSKIVLASGNKGKLAEFRQLFSEYGIEILPQSEFNVPEAPETGTTFVENAIIKARHAAEITGRPSISDDSGIEADYLDGQPGIRSARYSGESADADSNNRKLLEALNGVENRKARFQCVLVYMRHAKDPNPIIAQASWEGAIARRPRGGQGHGYDPLFIPRGLNMTAAQISAEEKNAISHRGKALCVLIASLKAQGVIS